MISRERETKERQYWQIPVSTPKSETGHGTQKPVECMRRPIENNASPGQAVYEPFSGSGTTIIAAEMAVARAGRLRAVQRLGHDDNRG